jgi:hypothetical protein
VSGSGLDFDTTDDQFGQPIANVAETTALLDSLGVDLFGLQFRGSFSFTSSIEALGGVAFETTDDTDSIVSSITKGIVAGFGDYSSVTVDDLGVGLPFIDVTVECKTADIGTCDGAEAKGAYTRSATRVFEFAVTFTRLAAGSTTFNTYGLVDGGIVATEVDTFNDGSAVIPLPAAGWLLIGGVGALGAISRRKKKAS